MTRININTNKRQTRVDFLDFLAETYERLIDDNIARDIIVPHICGMIMTASYAGLITDEDADALALALLIDECNE